MLTTQTPCKAKKGREAKTLEDKLIFDMLNCFLYMIDITNLLYKKGSCVHLKEFKYSHVFTFKRAFRGMETLKEFKCWVILS